MNKQLTDNEIVKDCKNCIRYTTCIFCIIGGRSISKDCNDFVELDTINRLQAENERLKSDVSVSRDAYMSMKDRYEYEKEKVEKAKQKCIDIGKALKNAKAEAYKEFAERLKEKSKQGKGYLGNVYHSVDVAEIDNLLKEMVGDKE